eukprot:12603521-Ditylum_brightwellii.AAC.2
MKASKKEKKQKFGIIYKFGAKVPRTVNICTTKNLDRENRDIPCLEVQQKEAATLRNMVVNGKVTIGPPEEDVWFSVVNTKSVRTIIFLAMLNDMRILTADISSAYLMAETREKMYTKLGPELGNQDGKHAIIRKALYGLVGSCAQFHHHLCGEMAKLGFAPSKVDQDLWMRDADNHYKYIAKYIGNILIVARNSMAILDQLKNPLSPCNFKGVGSPEYYLRGDAKVVYLEDFIKELSLSAKIYANCIYNKVEQLMGQKFQSWYSALNNKCIIHTITSMHHTIITHTIMSL